MLSETYKRPVADISSLRIQFSVENTMQFGPKTDKHFSYCSYLSALYNRGEIYLSIGDLITSSTKIQRLCTAISGVNVILSHDTRESLNLVVSGFFCVCKF